MEANEKVIDELFRQYELDHSLRSVAYNHPMFYNETFSENNQYQPEKPEVILNKEDFINELKNEDNKWAFGYQVLYLSRVSKNYK